MTATGEELLAHIVESPGDTEARLVYADWLLERGDLRGELIRLQCEAARGALDDRRAKRLRGLLRSQSKRWLGPIAAVTEVRSRVWDRGFLAAARVEAGHYREMQDAIGHPEWRTVRFLHTGSHSHGIDLVAHPIMRSLRAVTRLLGSQFRALSEGGRPLGIEELDLLEWRTGGDCELKELGACRALPRLRVLAIGERSPDEIPWLFESPLCERLQVFGMDYNVGSPASWQAALDRAGSFPVDQVGFGSFALPSEARIGFQLTLSRAEGGAWSRVILRRPPDKHPHARLVAQLESLRVTELVLVGFDEREAAKVAEPVRGRARVTIGTSE